MFYRIATAASQNSVTILCPLSSVSLSQPKSGPRKTMKLGALPNLSSLVSLSCHCYCKGCGAKGLVGSGLGLVWGRSEPAVTCLGGVSALLGLVIVPRLSSPPPARHRLERNRKGRAKISKVVAGWPSLARLHCLDNQLPRESTEVRSISFLYLVAC